MSSGLLTHAGFEWVQAHRVPIVALSWLCARGYALWGLLPSSDIARYFDVAGHWLHGAGYSHEYAAAYLPGPAVLSVVLRLAAPTLATYGYAFAATMLTIDLLIVALLWRATTAAFGQPVCAGRARRCETVIISLAYIALTCTAGPQLFQRHELAVGALALALVFGALRGWRAVWIDLLSATSLSMTPYAAVLVPLLWGHGYRLHLASSPRASPSLPRYLSRRAVGLAAGLVGFFALWFLFVGADLPGFVAYHISRGLPLDGGASSVLLLFEQLGSLELDIEQVFHTHYLRGPFAEAAARACGLLSTVAYATVVVRFIATLRRQQAPGAMNLVLIRGALATLVAVMITSSFLSPQRLVAIIPLASLLAAELRHELGPLFWRVLAACALTGVLKHFYEDDLLRMEALPVLILCARNVLVAWLAVSLTACPAAPAPLPGGSALTDCLRQMKARAMPVVPLSVLTGWVATAAFSPAMQNDLWIQLRVAKDFLASGAFPYHDSYSAVAGGRAFIAHEWLSGLIFYGLASLAPEMLTLLKMTIAAAITMLLWRSLSAANRGFVLSVPLLALASYLVLDRVSVRPHLFTLLLVSVWVFALERWRRSRRLRHLALLPAVQPLWANLHGGYVLAVVLGLTVTCAAGLSALLPPERQEEHFTPRQVAQLGLTTVATLLASLLNPYGWRLLRFSVEMATGNTYIRQYIREWVSPFEEPERRVFILACVMLSLAMAGLLARAKRLPLIDAALVLLTLVMVSSARRFAPLAGLLGFVVAVRHWRAIVDVGTRIGRRRAAFEVPAVLLLFASTLAYGHSLGESEYRSSGWGFGGDMPYAAAEQMRQRGLSGTVYNEYADGALLIYVLHPSVLPVMDSRIDVYGETLAEEFFATRDDWHAFVAYLKKYDVSYALLRKDERKKLVAALSVVPWAKRLFATRQRVLFALHPSEIEGD